VAERLIAPVLKFEFKILDLNWTGFATSVLVFDEFTFLIGTS